MITRSASHLGHSRSTARLREREPKRPLGSPAHQEQHGGEPDNVGERHVPTLRQPSPDRAGLGEQVRHSDTSRRAEPDHRPAKAYAIGKHAPVVATLLQGERGQRIQTADTKPRPNVAGQEAAGNLSTGISEAQATSDRRKTAPLAASGTTDQSSLRHTAVPRISTQCQCPSWPGGRKNSMKRCVLAGSRRASRPRSPSRANMKHVPSRPFRCVTQTAHQGHDAIRSLYIFISVRQTGMLPICLATSRFQ